MKLQPWTKPNMSPLIRPLGSEALLQRSAQPYRLVLTHGFQPPLDPVTPVHSKMFRLIISSEKKKKAPTLLVLFSPSLAGFIGSRVLPLSQAHLSLLWAILPHSMGHFFVNYYLFLDLLPFLWASKLFHQKSLPSQQSFFLISRPLQLPSFASFKSQTFKRMLNIWCQFLPPFLLINISSLLFFPPKTVLPRWLSDYLNSMQKVSFYWLPCRHGLFFGWLFSCFLFLFFFLKLICFNYF